MTEWAFVDVVEVELLLVDLVDLELRQKVEVSLSGFADSDIAVDCRVVFEDRLLIISVSFD